ncbi:NADPH:quinone reductase [Dactylosporangium sp. NPDC051484]|uniref:NADPH:quinone reductase n=1 Tax=Dactylosporangium sp. NPDC051484 TaxID=3154942 RepID=UPI00344FF3F4
MKAISFTKPGPSSVLEYGELPTPEPAAGEVRVRIAKSGVNPSDWKSRARAVYEASGERTIPHHDGAGVIDAVGEGVDPARIGQRVWLYFAAWQRPGGTAAQWTTVPDRLAVPLPDDVPDEVGASLGVPAITAHNLLGNLGALKGGTVLVNGFGAVGFAALQLATWAGARVVVSTSSAEKRDLAKRLGADDTLDPTHPDNLAVARGLIPEKAIRIVEPALGANIERDLAVLAPSGTIAIYATEGPAPSDLPVRSFINLNGRLEFTGLYWLPRESVTKAVEGINEALDAGYLRGYPIHRFALEETAAAHDALAGGIFGKVIIDVP